MRWAIGSQCSVPHIYAETEYCTTARQSVEQWSTRAAMSELKATMKKL